jgi:hypothetical protein
MLAAARPDRGEIVTSAEELPYYPQVEDLHVVIRPGPRYC